MRITIDVNTENRYVNTFQIYTIMKRALANFRLRHEGHAVVIEHPDMTITVEEVSDGTQEDRESCEFHNL